MPNYADANDDYKQPPGAIARRKCKNPFCEAEPGERHDPDCTPEPNAPRLN